MAELVIEADNLRRTFKDLVAVSGISFGVQRGEIFGLLGPNGAGKTATIRMLTGQIDLSAGRATVAGCDVAEDRTRLKELLGVVFEEQNPLRATFGTRQLALQLLALQPAGEPRRGGAGARRPARTSQGSRADVLQRDEAASDDCPRPATPASRAVS
jgi:ABC-type uncharacterized transport system ATPase component